MLLVAGGGSIRSDREPRDDGPRKGSVSFYYGCNGCKPGPGAAR